MFQKNCLPPSPSKTQPKLRSKLLLSGKNKQQIVLIDFQDNELPLHYCYPRFGDQFGGQQPPCWMAAAIAAIVTAIN